MRYGLFTMVLVIVLASSWAVAGGKGKSGGGQGHGARPHPSSTHPSNASRPLSATATSSLPVMMYGSMLPFGSNPGLALYHGYHASRNHYGNGRGNRGYGYRNSMVNNRMMHLSRLVRDLNTLTVGYAASPNDRNILRNDLMGVTQGGIKPPSPAVQQLSSGLISHLPSRRTPFINTERLALDLEAVMNGSRLPPTRVNQAISSAQSILRSSGVPQAGIQALSADLKAVGSWRVAGNQAGFVR